MNNLSQQQTRFLSHLAFWLVYLYLVSSYVLKHLPFGQTLAYSCLVALVHVVFAYLNIYLLFPLFLAKKRFLIYAIIVFLLIQIFAFIRTIIMPLHLARELLNENLVNFNELYKIMLSPSFGNWVISTAYCLGRDWFKNFKLKTQLMNKNLEAELKFLKTQINPHFLFNTLNNLYTLCLLKDDKAAPVVMKLSNMMRYMLYEASEDTIPLEKEINLLEDFIELQKLKTEREQDIEFKVDVIHQGLNIPPMLLLTLLENSFKHGNVDTQDDGWIKAHLSWEESQGLCFEVENTFSETPKNEVPDSGIGLKNVSRRLSLLYPSQHKLEIARRTNTFYVKLVIQF